MLHSGVGHVSHSSSIRGSLLCLSPGLSLLAQALLLSHQLHHLQSHVSSVRGNLQASSGVSALSTSPGRRLGRHLEALCLERSLLCDSKCTGSCNPERPLKRGSFWKLGPPLHWGTEDWGSRLLEKNLLLHWEHLLMAVLSPGPEGGSLTCARQVLHR